MSFVDDVNTDIENFKNNILSLNRQISDYKQKCDVYFREYFLDVNIIKQDMKDTIAKAVFISSLEGESDE